MSGEYVPSQAEVEAAARALYAEERNESMGFDEWPDYDDADNAARPIFQGHARAALVAAHTVAPREDVAEQIARAIEAEHLTDDTGAREDEAYDDAIRLAARIARSFANPT